jgi:threonine dehydratase
MRPPFAPSGATFPPPSDLSSLPTITRANISSTYDVIRAHLRRTPVLEVDAKEFGIKHGRVFFKLEQLQHAGSFKTRGAFANMLSRNVPQTGVVAASGGNHGAAVAYAAMQLGIPATIFVPRVSSLAKTRRISSYGAQLIVEGQCYADALAASQEFAKSSGALEIHAFDQDETMLGQGTIGLELEEQRPGLDTVMASVGGGGLLAGLAGWYHGRAEIIGVEPQTAPTLTKAFAAGRPVDADVGGIAIDSLAPRRVGERVFAVLRPRVKTVVLVPDSGIATAQETLWDALRIVAEAGGAAAFAALLTGSYKPAPDERIGVVVSGGNTTAVEFRDAHSAQHGSPNLTPAGVTV